MLESERRERGQWTGWRRWWLVRRLDRLMAAVVVCVVVCCLLVEVVRHCGGWRAVWRRAVEI